MNWIFPLMLAMMSMGLPPTGSVVLPGAPVATIQQVFAGKVAPLTMAFGALTPAWRRVRINDTIGLVEMANGIASDMRKAHDPRIYTRGQCVTIEGETYLIAYRLVAPVVENGEQVLPPPLARDTPLTLSLVKYATCQQFLDIAAVNPRKEIAAANKPANRVFPVKPAAVSPEETSLLQLRQVATAMQMFVQDNKGKYPTFHTSRECGQLLMPYLGKPELLIDPRAGEPYLFNLNISGHHEAEIGEPVKTVVVFEAKPGRDDTRGAAFADGHARRLRETRWAQVKADGKFPVVEEDEVNALSDARLRLLATAVKNYMQDQGRQYPPFRDPQTIKTVLAVYLSQPDAFTHPLTHEAYGFNTRLSMRLEKSIIDRAGTPMIFESAPTADGTRGVIFADGHLERLPADKWEILKKAAGIE